jgi:hypothetical protein
LLIDRPNEIDGIGLIFFGSAILLRPEDARLQICDIHDAAPRRAASSPSFLVMCLRVDYDSRDGDEQKQNDRDEEGNRKPGNMSSDNMIALGWIDRFFRFVDMPDFMGYLALDVTDHCAGSIRSARWLVCFRLVSVGCHFSLPWRSAL